mgnify:FL=1
MTYRVTSGIIPKTKIVPADKLQYHLDLATYCIIRNPNRVYETRQADASDKTIITTLLDGRVYSTTEITPALGSRYDYSQRDERIEAVFRHYLGE